MKNSILFSFLFFWTLTPGFSQNESVTAFHHKAQDFQGMILLKCNVGYYYMGPHLFSDEIFSYEIKGDKIIRSFDIHYSFKKRVDTLIISKNSVEDINGLSFKRVNSRKRDKLIERFIYPTADIGFFEIFLERTSACKNRS